MEATFTEGTITAALGISDKWGDTQHQKSIQALKEEESVSDVLEKLGKDAKVEELGVSSQNLTPYENKLMMVGFFVGSAVAQANVYKNMDNPMEMLLRMMGGMGKD
jgi:hypothetical protein